MLFTTETFAMGLNMPARTVVYTNLKKYDGMEERCVFKSLGETGHRALRQLCMNCQAVDNT